MFNEDTMYQLAKLQQGDSAYQQLLKACLQAEEGYLEILSKLSDEEQETLERYISLCEEMTFRQTQLAYELARSAR